MIVKLLNYTPNPLQTIEIAASKCYDSTPTDTGRIAMSCYNSGHLSVFEHASFTFNIMGISRFCLAQLTRHRLASPTVRSQRYCDETNASHVIPPTIRNNDEALAIYEQAHKEIAWAYNELRKLEIPAEDARFVLANSCETQLTFTLNFRELMHFCNERMCEKAQWEIRTLAIKMAALVSDIEPQLGALLVPKCEQDKNPRCRERNGCGRH